MRGLETKKNALEGDRQTHTWTDFVTTRKNPPKDRFFKEKEKEKNTIYIIFSTEISVHFGIPNIQISLHFGVHQQTKNSPFWCP